MTTALARTAVRQLALPSLLLVGLAAVIAGQTDLIDWPRRPVGAVAAPETVVIAARPFSYRASGAYLEGGYPVDGPLIDVAAPAPLEIMTHEVGAADYLRCVEAGACRPAEPKRHGTGDVPVTGVSFADATEYAAWLSQQTGTNWRLPTIEEWVFAAGSQAVDPVLAAETDNANPAERWLAQYEKEAALGVNAFATPEPRGTFGANEFGVFDIEGPVWEWTATCDTRTHLDNAGNMLSTLESCGVRLLEGRHRAAMSYFVRDGRAGGCAVGAPPDNLGFRLVRERGWMENVTHAVWNVLTLGRQT